MPSPNTTTYTYSISVIGQKLPPDGRYPNPEEKFMALVRFLARSPSVAYAMTDGQTCRFVDPATKAMVEITFHKLFL